jgi:hypothetical protein
MLCSPLKNKNTLLYLVVCTLPLMLKEKNVNIIKLLATRWGLIYSVGIVILLVFNYYSKNMKNQNIIESMKRLPEGATYMDYVSQSAVMSNRLGRWHGGGLSGGILGGLIGSRMGRR